MLENLDAGSSRSSAKSNARPGLPPSRECTVVPMPLTTFSKAKRTVDSVNLYDPATWQRGTGRKTHLSWPSSPPARQAAAPVRGGEESGLAPRQQQRRTGYTHTQWVSYDWFSGSKKNREKASWSWPTRSWFTRSWLWWQLDRRRAAWETPHSIQCSLRIN